MKSLARVFKALCDETRLSILALLLKRGELCVCDFVEVMAITQSKASRHLRYLNNTGLLLDRRAGIWVYYRINDEVTGEAQAILRAIKPLLEGLELDELEKRLDRWLKEKEKPCGSCTAPSLG